jgi:hypothetical protein
MVVTTKELVLIESTLDPTLLKCSNVLPSFNTLLRLQYFICVILFISTTSCSLHRVLKLSKMFENLAM